MNNTVQSTLVNMQKLMAEIPRPKFDRVVMTESTWAAFQKSCGQQMLSDLNIMRGYDVLVEPTAERAKVLAIRLAGKYPPGRVALCVDEELPV